MLQRLAILLLAAAAFALPAGHAEAHPHVFVTVQSRLVYADGKLSAVKHAWRFDDMFSSFASQGLDTDGDGKLSREELKELAEVNVTSLKEFDFFTFAKAGGKEIGFAQPVDYWLEHDGKVLTLHFTLPVRQAQADETTRVEIYDPSYFVSFSLAEENAAGLDGAPDGCRVDAEGPNTDTSGQKLSEDFFSNLQPGEGWGKQFANVMTVRCGDAATVYAQTLAPPAAPEPVPPVEPAPPAETAADSPAAPPVDVASRVDQALRIAESAPLQDTPKPEAAQKSMKPAGSALGAFGVVRPDGAAQPTNGFFGWIARQQSGFYKAMSDALAKSKEDGSAFMVLAALSFVYGVFHAAGPGHGKAVISSYLLATGETLRRGILISLLASLAQAVTAVAVVGVFAVLLGATSQAMGVAAWWLEAASYALIVALGIGLMFRRSLIPLTHKHDENCDHSHGPRLEDLDGPFGWRRAGAAVLAIGLRPCTGALLILVFALTQGLVWAGIASTFIMALGTALTVSVIAALAVIAKQLALWIAAGSSTVRTRKALRLVEIAAGFVVLAFGLMLLGGLLTAGVPPAAAG